MFTFTVVSIMLIKYEHHVVMFSFRCSMKLVPQNIVAYVSSQTCKVSWIIIENVKYIYNSICTLHVTQLYVWIQSNMRYDCILRALHNCPRRWHYAQTFWFWLYDPHKHFVGADGLPWLSFSQVLVTVNWRIASPAHNWYIWGGYQLESCLPGAILDGEFDVVGVY